MKSAILADLITSAHVDICCCDHITAANTKYVCISLSAGGLASRFIMFLTFQPAGWENGQT